MEEDPDGALENPAAESKFSTAEMRQFEHQAEVKLLEKKLMGLFRPLESFIMSVQSLLVWEKPSRSVVMLLGVNILFWWAVTTQCRVIFLAAVSCIVFISMETIKNRVWPEIRVKQPDDDEESWTPIHPKLLSLPEICEHIAKLWVAMGNLNTMIWLLRKEQPSKFCLYVCSLCLVLAAIGHYLSGILLSYLTLVSLLLWPPVEYHNIFGKFFRRIEPILQQLDHSIDSPSRREKKLRPQQKSSKLRAYSTYDSSSDDSDLEEFCPTPSPSVDAALAHAAGRCGRRTLGSSLSVVGLSKGMSLDLNTDDEFTDTEPPSYMGDITHLPSFDNTTFDHSADELEIDLPYDDRPLVPARPEANNSETTPESPESMQFVPSHFQRESSDVENYEGLEFPTVNSQSRRANERKPEEEQTAALPPIAAMFLTQTVSSIVSEAMTKLQRFSSADQSDGSSESTRVAAQQLPPSQQAQIASTATPKRSLVTVDSDLEFEVLNRDELEAGTEDENPSSGKPSTTDADKPKSGYNLGFLTSWLSPK